MTDIQKEYLEIDTSALKKRQVLQQNCFPKTPVHVDSARLIETISSIYQTITEPNLWEGTLNILCELVNAKAGMSGIFDVTCPEVHRHSSSSKLNESELNSLLNIAARERYERFVELYHLPPQTLMHFPDDRKKEASKFDQFTDTLKNQHGIHRLVSANANPNSSWFDYLTLFFGADNDQISSSDNETITFLLPHIAKANATRRPLELLKQRYKAIFGALDWLAFGVLLVRADHSIMAANRAARAMLEDGDGIRRTGNDRLAAAKPDSELLLNSQISEAISAAQQQNIASCQTRALPRFSGKTPYILEVTPFIDTDAGELNMSVQGALIFCIDPEEHAQISPKGLAEAYKFTPAETEICRHVLEGMSNDQIADTKNVGLSTVKTHVKALLSKTHTNNRSSLIRLAVNITPPIVEPT